VLSFKKFENRIQSNRFLFLGGMVLLELAVLVLFVRAEAQPPIVNWEKISRLKPDLRVLILVTSPNPLSLEDLASLSRLGMNPADRDPAMVFGLKKAIFSVPIKNWRPENLPGHLRGELLDRFLMSGIYRVSFKVEEKGFDGPLTLEMAAPRGGFGKYLIDAESLVRPLGVSSLTEDSAGNRWFRVDYPKIRSGESIRFHFAFRYRVDLSSLLDHDLMVLERAVVGPVPENVRVFLDSGHKIDTQLPEVIAWAQGRPRPGSDEVLREYRKVKQYIDKRVQYDDRKKSRYFGGKAIYCNLDDMYQDIPTTLAQKLGACPDTSVLECAFLRAEGIPCRTAGRFGHFFTELYVSGRGWVSTSVHPTGIPLIVAPGPDNVSYQKWNPPIALRTVTLDKKIRLETLENQP
jgi:hypothetical protein